MDPGGVIARVVAWAVTLGWVAQRTMPVVLMAIVAVLLTAMLWWDIAMARR